MNEPVTDLWEQRALPILRYIGAHETDLGLISIAEMSRKTGIEGHEGRHRGREVDRVGYITGTLQKSTEPCEAVRRERRKKPYRSGV